jgi:hypothetical protein
MMILSSDNKFELVKVNIENQESIIKKLIRVEKRKTLKRKRDEVDDEDVENDAIDTKVKIDKDEIVQRVKEGQYDIGLHFSKKLAFDLDEKSKAKSFQVLLTKSKQ